MFEASEASGKVAEATMRTGLCISSEISLMDFV